MYVWDISFIEKNFCLQPVSLFMFAYSEQHEDTVYIGAAGTPIIYLVKK